MPYKFPKSFHDFQIVNALGPLNLPREIITLMGIKMLSSKINKITLWLIEHKLEFQVMDSNADNKERIYQHLEKYNKGLSTCTRTDELENYLESYRKEINKLCCAWGSSPIRTAVRNDDLEMVELLLLFADRKQLCKKIDDHDVSYDYALTEGSSPKDLCVLCIAADHNNIEILQILLEKYKELGILEERLSAALFAALNGFYQDDTQENNQESVKILLKYGANPDKKLRYDSKREISALDYAKEKAELGVRNGDKEKNKKILAVLINKNEPRSNPIMGYWESAYSLLLIALIIKSYSTSNYKITALSAAKLYLINYSNISTHQQETAPAVHYPQGFENR